NHGAHRKSHALTEAKELLVRCLYDEAISLLTPLVQEFPDGPEIAELLETAQRDQREQRRQQSLTKARELLAARRHAECASLLMSLKEQYPGDEQIPKLLTAVMDDQVEQRKREGLGRARSLLSSRRYDESISILSELQKDFPSERELNKLLETACADRAEQQKQQKLAEARTQLAARSFAEAISLLDALAAEHPQDAGVVKLRAVARRELEKHARAERIQLELDALKKQLSEKQYSEVLSKTKQLLAEFPGEASFKRLAEFAYSRQEGIEREILLRGTLEDVKALFAASRFKDAILAAEAGLQNFPGDPELLDLHQQAEGQQRKLEIRQQIEGRVRDIRVKINREKFSEAIDLAKETLSAFGPDTDVSQLLTSAEVELHSREKKREQLGRLETIRTLIDSGDFEVATRSIDEAIETKTFETFDPRIQRLSEQIEDAKSVRTESAPASSLPPAISREYVFLQGPPPPEPAPDKVTIRPL